MQDQSIQHLSLEELKDQYNSVEIAYHEACDECGELAERLEQKRNRANELLDEMTEIRKQMIDAIEQVR
jgi:predicted nuclease with TOPRIM domain